MFAESQVVGGNIGIFGGGVQLVLQTLTLFQTKICNFLVPFSDMVSRMHTRFQTFKLNLKWLITKYISKHVKARYCRFPGEDSNLDPLAGEPYFRIVRYILLSHVNQVNTYFVLTPGGGGGGRGTPRNSWWGCAARVFKSRPYFRPKHAIFHTLFQT